MTSVKASRLGLGTVQWGMPYGVFNRTGQPNSDGIRSILQLAHANGISTLDTAALYGGSEEAIGACLGDGGTFNIVTKTPLFEAHKALALNLELLSSSFEASLRKLRRMSVYGLLIHRVADLLGEQGDALFERMQSLKQAGRVKKIGVSLYTRSEIDKVLDRYPIDLIQLPLNVLDQRLLKEGVLSCLKESGIEIHVRSAFLQGLLLQPARELPPYFQPAGQSIEAFQSHAHQHGMSPLRAALEFLFRIPEVDKIILGVETSSQLSQIIASLDGEAPLLDYSSFAFSDESILNPSRWPERISK